MTDATNTPAPGSDSPGSPNSPDPSGPPNASAPADGSRADQIIDAVLADPQPAPPAEPARTDGPPDPPSTGKPKRKKDKPRPTTFRGKLWYGWVKPIGTVFIVVALLRSTFIDWNDVPSGSMEPTIHVGDRILINKTAYALQFPLSGPRIGVPFVAAMQWDNPLDGLPSLQWGRPSRGEIVTFWNPVTGVRMVKRIVAEPGDTVELRGGVMTITPADGPAQTAAYTDLTPSPPRQTPVGINPRTGNLIEKFADDLEETLLGETRTIMHIPYRWTTRWGLVRLPDGGGEFALIDDQVGIGPDRTRIPAQRAQSEEGTHLRFMDPSPGVPLALVRQQYADEVLALEIIDGAPWINGEPATYNAFAAAYLAPVADGDAVDFDGTSVHADGHTWLIDGEPASSEQLQQLLTQRDYLPITPKTSVSEAQADLIVRMRLLRDLMLSSFGPVTLGDDQYYMVGDNRNNSADSRYFGPVQRSEITGEAIAVPVSFHGRIRDLNPRWERWFHGIE